MATFRFTRDDGFSVAVQAGKWSDAFAKARPDIAGLIEREWGDDRKVNKMEWVELPEGRWTISVEEGFGKVKTYRYGVKITSFRPQAPVAPRIIANGPATEKQIALLRKLGHPVPAGLNKRDASAILDDILLNR